jgi:hypothetical protein
MCTNRNVQPMKLSGCTNAPIRDETAKSSTPNVAQPARLLHMEVHILSLHMYRMYVAPRQYSSRAHHKYLLCPRGTLHM